MENVLNLCRGMEVVSFAIGDTLFPDGGQTGCLYILISGAVDVSKGDSLLAKIREPGAILGEIAVLLDQPHSATVEATEPTTCYVSHAGKDFLLSRPEFSLAVAELLALRLKGMIAYLADIKAQYEDRKDHLGMVDELLLNLAHRIPRKR